MMAKFRCGNEERENSYWMEREERRCRMYSEARETIEHMWKEWMKPNEREKGTGRNTQCRKEIGWMKEL
jgi:hypothetical protein